MPRTLDEARRDILNGQGHLARVDMSITLEVTASEHAELAMLKKHARNGPVLRLTREEIQNMRPNVPTPPRVFGTDSSLDWGAQIEYIRKASSKAVTRLYAMLDSAAEGSEVAEIVRALSQAQAMAMKALQQNGEGSEPTDEELIRKAKK